MRSNINLKPTHRESLRGNEAEALAGLTIHLISHNHWDREWIFTAKYTNRSLPPFFDNLFKMLAEQPDYRFVLDGQTLLIEDYLSQLPQDEAHEREKLLRRYAQEGRLMIGPAYLQPDWSLVSGEALVRNLMIGHHVAAQFGPVMKVGWMLDNFGQIAQAPQIYRGFEIEGVFVWRGVAMPPDELKSEFCWRAPDGSEVLAIFLVNSYRNGMALSLTRPIATQRILSEAGALRPFATTANVLLMNGYEQVPWPDDVLPLIDEVNRAAGGKFTCVQSTPPEYLAAVRQARPELPLAQGYFYSGRYMPILKGVFSSRSHLKLLNNECQRELERWAEPFATVAWALGAEYPKTRLEKAWKTLLLNQTHDDVCGCCIDQIARDMESRFKQVYQIATDITEESLMAIAEAVNTARPDSLIALVVFNPSPRRRQDVISFSMALPAGVSSFSIKDGLDRPAPYHMARQTENKIDLHLYVDDIPSLGYKTYYLSPGLVEIAAHPRVTALAETQTMENDYLRVKINEDGSLDVTHKQSGQLYQNLGYFEDGGDAGDTYDYSYPYQDTIITSLGRPAVISLVEAGPLLARFKVEIDLNLPESLTADRQARSPHTRPYPIVSYVELAAGSRRVEIKTLLHNGVKDHRLRVMFPSGIKADFCYAEEPFDVARLPVAGESPPSELPEQVGRLMLAGRYTAPINTHPFQNFVDYSDGKKGLAVISRRVMEYEILPEKEGALALTLLRCVGWLARYDLQTRSGDVGPHIFTPEAQCLGDHIFQYAIYPHQGDWSEDETQIQAFSHNLKLRAVQSFSPGPLPSELSFASLTTVEPAHAFRMTALKRAEAGDGVIIRFFNTLDRAVQGEVQSWWGDSPRVFRANLNEEEQAELPQVNGVIRLEAGPKEIVTLKLKLNTRLLIETLYSEPTKLLPPLLPGDKLPQTQPPVITQAEVQAEEERTDSLQGALLQAKAAIFTLEDDIERTASQNDIAKQLELQKLRTEIATLTRQVNEARISALLNRQLYLNNQIEAELAEIGEAMAWSRTKKRAGEYLVHYYESLGQQALAYQTGDKK